LGIAVSGRDELSASGVGGLYVCVGLLGFGAWVEVAEVVFCVKGLRHSLSLRR